MNTRSDRRAAVKKLKTLVLSPKIEINEYRKAIEKEFSCEMLPAGVECTEQDAGGVKYDLLTPVVYASNRIIFYIHGGSFVGGSRSSYRNFCSSLANDASCRVAVPEYRLAPEHPFPASVDDILTAFRTVYADEKAAARLENSAAKEGEDKLPEYTFGLKDEDEDKKKEEPGGNIIIASDGSGASLTLALMFRMTEDQLKSVKKVVFFSPWLDLSRSSPLLTGRRVYDEVLSGDSMRRASDLYTYDSNSENIFISPLKAPPKNFEGFPPFFIQMGEKEILVQQVKEFEAILASAKVECTLDIWPNMMYMFQFADEFLNESHLAVEKAGKEISKRPEEYEESEEEKSQRQKILDRNNIRSE